MTGEIRVIETLKYNPSFSAVNEYILLKGRSIVRRTNQIHNFDRDGMERVFTFTCIENATGTYKVRNEIETKRNETKRNEINKNETKRNEINETKRNQRNENEMKRSQRKQNEIN